VGPDAVQVAARAGGRRCPDADRGGRGHVRGTGLAVTFFETEDDLRAGDEVLNAMTPPVQGAGRRTSVEVYEVAVEMAA